jgi:hypothetical protein
MSTTRDHLSKICKEAIMTYNGMGLGETEENEIYLMTADNVTEKRAESLSNTSLDGYRYINLLSYINQQ